MTKTASDGLQIIVNRTVLIKNSFTWTYKRIVLEPGYIRISERSIMKCWMYDTTSLLHFTTRSNIPNKANGIWILFWVGVHSGFIIACDLWFCLYLCRNVWACYFKLFLFKLSGSTVVARFQKGMNWYLFVGAVLDEDICLS